MSIAPQGVVLIAEDDDSVRRSLCAQFVDWNFRVIEAADGVEAKSLFDLGGMDLVFIDLRLPKVDGLDVLAHIRQKSPETATIVISGAGTIHDVVAALKLGTWDYLFKPIHDMEMLKHAVDRAMERRLLLREQKEYQQRLEREVERRTAELQRVGAIKDELLSRVSHELRTPLTPILLLLGELRTDPEVPATYRDDLQMACHFVEMEARLIDDMLDMSAILSRRFKLRRSVCDLYLILRAAIETCQSEIKGKVAMEVKLAGGTTKIAGDSGRLQQVFCHLIRNAVKFTPAGGQITISGTAAAKTGDSIEIEIVDTGIGMTPEILKGAFTPLGEEQRGISDGQTGLRLGLSLCKTIVELHDGRIDARSEGLGKGLAFTVSLKSG